MSAPLKKTCCTLGKLSGSSPSEDRYYVVVLFDISDAKKYRQLVKLLKRYGSRIQKSVFEGQLKPAQVKSLLASIEKLMLSERYYNLSDNIRMYKIAGNCDLTVFGSYEETLLEENMFF